MPWVPLLPADAIGPEQIVAVEVVLEGDPPEAFPLDVVVWRTAAGRLSVVDARCPHQWSHLGAEGAVDGEELVCLSHHWRFTPDGAGGKRNVLGRLDEKAPIPVFLSRVHAGWIEIDLERPGRASTAPRG